MTEIPNWHEYPYNYSGGTKSVDGIGNFIDYTAVVTNQGLIYGFILIIWLATFGISQVAGARKGLAVASFITFLLSIYFARLGAIPMALPITLLILTGIGIILGGKDDSISL